jgi:hypothetical protein
MLRKLTVLLSALAMLGVMAVPPVMAVPAGGFNPNNGNKNADGLDPNQGGGQERPKNERPPHAGGDQHGGGLSSPS